MHTSSLGTKCDGNDGAICQYMAHQSRTYLLCRTKADATYRLGSLYMLVLQIKLQVAYDFELLIKSLDKVFKEMFLN